MLDSIYHIALKLIKNAFVVKRKPLLFILYFCYCCLMNCIHAYFEGLSEDWPGQPSYPREIKKKLTYSDFAMFYATLQWMS